VGKIRIPESELEFDFVRASGPGGQHVNKAATAVQLRFDVAHSPSLPESVRRRLLQMGGQRITDEGVLIIDAREHRSQARNREAALQRFMEVIQKAARKPKRRVKTRVPSSAKRRRLENKQRRSEKKRRRKPPRRW
jgi:ribosome-associated protein